MGMALVSGISTHSALVSVLVDSYFCAGVRYEGSSFKSSGNKIHNEPLFFVRIPLHPNPAGASCQVQGRHHQA